MKLFSFAYNKIIALSKTEQAPYFLGGISFIEAIFLPFPPDIMLATMVLANKKKWLRYCVITLLSSVAGGVLGYFLGLYFIDIIHPYIVTLGYENSYLQVQHWFEAWGFLIVFVAGFTPIPYKLFTIGAGAFAMNLALFVIASMISRGARYALISYIAYRFEEKLTNLLVRYLDYFGWISIILLAGYFYFSVE